MTFDTSNTERMRIDSAGRVGIGSSTSTGASVNITNNITGATATSSLLANGAIQSDVTVQANYFNTSTSTQAAAFTLGDLRHYNATQATIGAGSAVTNQYGFAAQSSLIGATNNYGFYGNIASGTNRWNFYAAGTATNYFAGNVGIGTTAPTAKLDVVGTAAISGAVTAGASITTGSGVSTGDCNFELGGSRTGDGNSFIDFHSSAGTDSELRIIRTSGLNGNTSITNAGTGAINLNCVGAGTMTFATTNTERIRIDSAGVITARIGTAIPAGGTAGFGYCATSTANFGVFFGSGAPTLSAAKGSLYLRSDGTTVNDRMYVNTNGSTTWTNVVTSA
jgi:hypothetical protein